jgi:hypothetical protein
MPPNENEIVLTVKTDEDKTIGELRQHIRDLGKELDKLSTNDLEGQRRINRERSLAKDALESYTREGLSSNAKMKESYFQLGQGLRQHRADIIGLVDSLGFSTGGLGFTLKALAGPVGLPMFVGLLAGASQAAKETRDEVDKLIKSGVSDFLGLKGAMPIQEMERAQLLAQQRMKETRERMKQVDLQMKEELVSGYEVMDEKGNISRLMGPSSATAAEYKNLDKRVKTYQEISDQLDVMITKQRTLNEVMVDAAALGIQTAKSAKEWREAVEGRFAAQTGGGIGPVRLRGREAPPRTAIFGAGVFSGYSDEQIEAQNRQFVANQPGYIAPQPEKDRMRITALQSHVIDLGRTMTSTLSNAFVQSFDLGNSLIDQLKANFLSKFADVFISTLLGFIPGAIGFGLGQGGLGAGSNVIDTLQAGRIGGGVGGITTSYGGSSSMRVQIIGKLGLTDLALGVARGNRLRSANVLT